MFILRLLGYLWSLPQLVVLGLPLALIYRAHSWTWSDGCLEAIGGDRMWGRPGAQTHGFLIFYRDERQRGRARLRVHERVHVLQAMIGGPLYTLSYGLHWLWLFAVAFDGDDERPRWQRAYYRVWAERQAYRIDREFDAGERPGAWGS